MAAATSLKVSESGGYVLEVCPWVSWRIKKVCESVRKRESDVIEREREKI